MAETSVKVDNVYMMFNLSKNKQTSLKEYVIDMVKGNLFFDEFWALENIGVRKFSAYVSIPQRWLKSLKNTPYAARISEQPIVKIKASIIGKGKSNIVKCNGIPKTKANISIGTEENRSVIKAIVTLERQYIYCGTLNFLKTPA